MKTPFRFKRILLIVFGVIILLIITMLYVPIVAGHFDVVYK